MSWNQRAQSRITEKRKEKITTDIVVSFPNGLYNRPLAHRVKRPFSGRGPRVREEEYASGENKQDHPGHIRSDGGERF